MVFCLVYIEARNDPLEAQLSCQLFPKAHHTHLEPIADSISSI